MDSDKFDPGDSSLVLHLDHQAAFDASDVENHPVIAT